MHGGCVIKTPFYHFYFTKFYAEQSGRPYKCSGSRLAVIIKKKVGTAVVRNYEKRIVRQLFRCTATESDIDLVVCIKQSGGDFKQKEAVFCQAMSEIDRYARSDKTNVRRFDALNENVTK